MVHSKLLEIAYTAIGRVHSDQSVNLEETLESLESLRDYIEELISAIEEDIEREVLGV